MALSKKDKQFVERLAARIKMIEMFRSLGEDRLPELRLSARTMNIHPGLVTMLEKFVQGADDDEKAFAELTAKFGFSFKKYGLAEYFGKYVALMSVLKAGDNAASIIEESRLKTNLIEIELSQMAVELECSREDLIPTLKAYAKFIPNLGPRVERLEVLLSELETGKSAISEGDAIMNRRESGLKVMAGNIAFMERRVPDSAKKLHQKLILMLWKRLGGSTKSDFDEVRAIADAFLRGSLENPKVAELVAA